MQGSALALSRNPLWYFHISDTPLPETCLCLCHGCTPPPQSGSWTVCRRCCVGLYSSPPEKENKTTLYTTIRAQKKKSFDVWFCFSKQLMWYLHRFTVTNCSTHEYYRWISADVTSKMERETTCMVLMKWEVLHRKIHKKTVLNYQVTRM